MLPPLLVKLLRTHLLLPATLPAPPPMQLLLLRMPLLPLLLQKLLLPTRLLPKLRSLNSESRMHRAAQCRPVLRRPTTRSLVPTVVSIID